MSKFDLESLTPPERLLWSHGIDSPEHIDLEAIANIHGADVRIRRLGGCDARLVVCGERAVISLNASSSDGRRRFSLAHELAHLICDRKTGSFLCAKDDIGPQNAESRSVESAANGYASQLVLPTFLVDPWIADKPVSFVTAKALAEAFRVSITAAAIKLVKRTSQQAALVCHSTRGVAWRQLSASAQEWGLKGDLHPDTDAFAMVYSSQKGLSAPKRLSASHWIASRDAYGMDVVAQSLGRGDRYAITLLVPVSVSRRPQR
jgi:hypothetical protein